MAAVQWALSHLVISFGAALILSLHDTRRVEPRGGLIRAALRVAADVRIAILQLRVADTTPGIHSSPLVLPSAIEQGAPTPDEEYISLAL